jgi:predicted small metal-binding protein
MYRFACRDVGVNCNFVTTGKTVEEVKSQAFAHAGVVHADLLKDLSKEEMAKMTGAVEASIKFV